MPEEYLDEGNSLGNVILKVCNRPHLMRKRLVVVVM